MEEDLLTGGHFLVQDAADHWLHGRERPREPQDSGHGVHFWVFVVAFYSSRERERERKRDHSSRERERERERDHHVVQPLALQLQQLARP